jgi:RNA polymerase sigma factor FliA
VRIRGAVFDELRRLDWVPRSVHEKAKKIEKVMQELMQRTAEVPTDAQMAKALKISVDQYEELLEEIRPATYVCLDSAQNHDGEGGGGSLRRYRGRIADQSGALGLGAGIGRAD